MFVSKKVAAAIVEEKGLKQVSDTGAIEAFCDEVIAANPGPAEDFRAGKEAALNFLKGQVMKLSRKGESGARRRNFCPEADLSGLCAFSVARLNWWTCDGVRRRRKFRCKSLGLGCGTAETLRTTVSPSR